MWARLEACCLAAMALDSVSKRETRVDDHGVTVGGERRAHCAFYVYVLISCACLCLCARRGRAGVGHRSAEATEVAEVDG